MEPNLTQCSCIANFEEHYLTRCPLVLKILQERKGNPPYPSTFPGPESDNLLSFCIKKVCCDFSA